MSAVTDHLGRVMREAQRTYFRERTKEALIASKQAEAAFDKALAAPAAQDDPGACDGCGSTQTIEAIRERHPDALSCCPERKMLTATQWRERALAAEHAIADASREVAAVREEIVAIGARIMATQRPALIWSFEHNAWWGPGGRGYVPAIEEAGRYSMAEATEIAIKALGGWRPGDRLPEIPIPEAFAPHFAAYLKARPAGV